MLSPQDYWVELPEEEHSCQAPCCQEAEQLEATVPTTEIYESPSFSDNYMNDRYSGVAHEFTDEQLMDVQRSQTNLDVGDIQGELIADDMATYSADNMILARTADMQRAYRTNQAIAASAHKRSIATGIAHTIAESWWGVE